MKLLFLVEYCSI